MIDVTDLASVLSRLMSEVESAATALSVELPDRRVLPSGGAVYDCEMVAVSALGLTAGLPSTQTPGGLAPCGPEAWSVQTEIAIVRKANEQATGPRGEYPPTVAMIQDDTDSVSADTAVLIRALGSYAGDARAATASFSIGQPQGGLIAVVATSSVVLWP